jgi:hypothetical protein
MTMNDPIQASDERQTAVEPDATERAEERRLRS